MKRNWLLVANAARARILEDADRPDTYTHVADLVHPQSRQKGIDIADVRGGDRPGHVDRSGHGLASTSYEPHTEPPHREHDRFASEVAGVLNQGVADGRCAGLVLVASDPFLGLVKAHLGVQSRKLLLRTVSSDYTTLRDDELAARLRGAP